MSVLVDDQAEVAVRSELRQAIAAMDDDMAALREARNALQRRLDELEAQQQ